MNAIDVEVEVEAWLTDAPDAEALAETAARAALAAVSDAPDGEIAILLTDDDTVRDLNANFRGKDEATNVLSFPAPPTLSGVLGDIALAHGVCAAEAEAQGKTLAAHLQHLVAHGVLHLLGLDHLENDQAEAMEAMERRILAGLGLADPYAETAHG